MKLPVSDDLLFTLRLTRQGDEKWGGGRKSLELSGCVGGWSLVALGKIAVVQEDLPFPDLKNAVTFLIIPFDNPGG